MVNNIDSAYSRYDFRNTTGYVVDHPQQLIAIGHTASVQPWHDPFVHQHDHSEEYYFLRKGRLEFQIWDFQLTLLPNEILMLKQEVPHAILGGSGKIEHFGIRAPARNDKKLVGKLNRDAPRLYEDERLISAEWGHRIPLDMPQHQNCWLIGAGSALYESEHLVLAYMDYPTTEIANADVGTRNKLHLHRKSWEYFLVLEGEETQMIEDARIVIAAGEIVAVPPNVKHDLHGRRAPYLGFTLRVPVELNDKIVFEMVNKKNP